MRKFFAGLILGIFLTASVSAIAATPIKIVVNGAERQSDVAPINTRGRVLVPIRLISESLGAQVTWNQQTQTVTVVSGSSTTSTTLPSTQTKTVTVDMKNIAFSPGQVTINKGDTIEWTNSDTVDHDIDGDNGEFSSQIIQPGGTFKHTFDTAGTINYHCEIHPSMTGVITVN